MIGDMVAKRLEHEKFVPYHVPRSPLPWRESDVTECGIPLAAVERTKDRNKVLRWIEKAKTVPVVKSLDSICGSCVGSLRALLNGLDCQEPLVVLMFRELVRAKNGSDVRFEAELEALVEVAMRHKEEFSSLAAAHLAALTLQRGLDQQKPIWKRMRVTPSTECP